MAMPANATEATLAHRANVKMVGLAMHVISERILSI
jgi:hypothetical protein